MTNSAGLFLFSVLMLLAFIFLCWMSLATSGKARAAFAITTPVPLISIALFYLAGLRFEFFGFVYYPIRFNRKTQNIHVFKHSGPNGVLTVPWERVFFHIGYDAQMKFLRNIRGEILDGDIVKETFAVGNDAEVSQEIYDCWEFIRRYMDEGPEAVADSPLDKYVGLSVSRNWSNCLICAILNCDAGTPSKRFWRAPFIYLYASTRWLIFRTCKQPVFSPDIEAESIVVNNDPNIWPIPDHTAQFHASIPAVGERSRERLRQTRDPKASTVDR
ncbi:DUF6708 domain-containing protein [Rhodanobacter sp. TND4FH1]